MAARALVFGSRWSTIEPVPALLSRAGFEVTLLSSNPRLRRCLHVTRFVFASSQSSLVGQALDELAHGYDLVVPGDDWALRDVRRAPWPVEDKLRLLPVSSPRGIGHIASKIGLSRALTTGGVLTPAFAVAENSCELEAALVSVGLPAMLKADFGAGGLLVVPVARHADIASALDILPFPLLVQRRINGLLVDCSGFFRNGEPVTFSRSVSIESMRRGLGPSVLRRYDTGGGQDQSQRSLLSGVGHALDANGFVSLSAIRSQDGRLHFFEADMRPNVWAEYPKYFGGDPAVAIARAYRHTLPPQPAAKTAQPETVMLPYLPRMRTIDILRNRHDCRACYENYAQRHILIDRVVDYFGGFTLRRIVAAARLFYLRSRPKV